MAAYQEVVIEGPRGRAIGFIEGYLVGKGRRGVVFDAESEGFDCEPLRERIREMLPFAKDTSHLLVPGSLVPMVHEAVERAASRGLSITVRDARGLAGVRFSYKFRIYSREHAARIRALMENSPRGVALSADARFDETEHPDAKGVEAYAPAHDYEASGSGAMEGTVPGVVSVYRVAREEQLVQVSPLEILEK